MKAYEKKGAHKELAEISADMTLDEIIDMVRGMGLEVTIEPKDFTPSKRTATLIRLRDGDFDGIIMAYSCFDRLPLSNDYLIERYEDEAFIEQEARRRLGVIEPGETAWRIVDERMVPEGQMTTSSDDEEVQPEWYEVLWDSIAEEPPEEDGMQMPVE